MIFFYEEVTCIFEWVFFLEMFKMGLSLCTESLSIHLCQLGELNILTLNTE